MKKPGSLRRISEKMRDEIIEAALEDENISRKDLALILENRYGDKTPSLDTLERMISQARNHPPSSLDNPWSLGSCLEKGISADVIVPIQRQCLHYGRFLTTRRARWYSVLHPVLFPLLERAYPEQEEENQIRLLQIASFYTHAEQIAKSKKECYPDTRGLDNTFIFSQDISFSASLREWGELYLRMPEKPAKVKVPEFFVSRLKAEEILAKEVGAGEGKLLNKFIGLVCDGDLEKAIALVEKRPGLQPLAEKWLALSLRRDIRITRKDGEK